VPEIDFFCDFCREEITRSQTMSWYLLRAVGVRPWSALVLHYPGCARGFQSRLDATDAARLERVAIELTESDRARGELPGRPDILGDLPEERSAADAQQPAAPPRPPAQ